MSDFCEKSGANIYEVAEGVGLDTRIGGRFLNPGPGYGGSCLPKDTNAIAHMGRKIDTSLSLIEAAIQGNEWRKKQMAWRILDCVKGLVNPKICILGLAFKAGTDDCRESPALTVIEYLLEHKMDLSVFDPQAMKNAKDILGDKVVFAKDEYVSAKDADVIVILTEWDCFKELDLNKIGMTMKRKKIIDLRNLIKPELAKNAGFEYYRIGAM
jgi:UDPglucose 6-dehydrogenase